MEEPPDGGTRPALHRLMAMKRLLEKLEAALVAAAFAEEGEVETARRIAAAARRDERAETGARCLVLRKGDRRAPVAKRSGG